MDNNSNLEQFLKSSTEGYRMQPSPKVWSQIQNELHGKKRLSLTALFSLFFIMGALGLLTNMDNNDSNHFEDNDFVFSENKNTNFQTPNLLRNEKKPEVTVQNKQFNSTASKEAKVINIKDYSFNANRPSPVDPSLTSNEVNNKEVDFTNSTTSIENEVEAVADKGLFFSSMQDVTSSATFPTDFSLKGQLPKGQEKSFSISDDNLIDIVSESKAKTKSAKSRFQYTFTPSISYRVLNNKSNSLNQNNAAQNIQDLDKAVFHKPALGLEFGAFWLKKIANPLHFKMGLQLNYNRYSIKATDAQPEVSTITLRATNGATYNQTLNTVSTLRNEEGFFPKWIENSNIQISIPVGFNVQFAGSKHVNFGIGTTIQPSYLLKTDNLLLSTDLKNYTKAPSLVNRFNLNTGLETFISVKHKNTQLQFGPSVRYQLLSTYNKKYPFKENLFDYGFKLAISRPL